MKIELVVEDGDGYDEALSVVRQYAGNEAEYSLLLSHINVRVLQRVRELGLAEDALAAGKVMKASVHSVSSAIKDHKGIAEKLPTEWLLSVSQIDNVSLEPAS